MRLAYRFGFVGRAVFFGVDSLVLFSRGRFFGL